MCAREIKGTSTILMKHCLHLNPLKTYRYLLTFPNISHLLSSYFISLGAGGSIYINMMGGGNFIKKFASDFAEKNIWTFVDKRKHIKRKNCFCVNVKKYLFARKSSALRNQISISPFYMYTTFCEHRTTSWTIHTQQHFSKIINISVFL